MGCSSRRWCDTEDVAIGDGPAGSGAEDAAAPAAEQKNARAEPMRGRGRTAPMEG
jgi:hypothetical protein